MSSVKGDKMVGYGFVDGSCLDFNASVM